MALARYLLDELLDTVNDPFDLNYIPKKLSVSSLRSSDLRHLIKSVSESEHGTISDVSDQKNRFKVNLDVQHFKPDEINLKVVNDYIVIEGKHEEKQDKHGFISRQFTRRYKVPENVNLDAVTSTISSDGILTVMAPKKIKAAENERQIPIVQTNQPAIKRAKCEPPNENAEKTEA